LFYQFNLRDDNKNNQNHNESSISIDKKIFLKSLISTKI